MKIKSSIIIPTHNKALWLDIVMYSLQKSQGIEECEVIVVDDGSTDSTKEVISAYEDKLTLNYIYEDHLGAGKARNTAVLNAKGDILIFIDDDRIVSRDFLQAHLNLHEKNNGKIIIIGRRQQLFLANLESKKQSIMQDICNDLQLYSKLSRIDDYEKVTDLIFDNDGNTKSKIAWISCIFANASIKRKDFIENGMFDENFKGWGCEDVEVGYRLLMNGIKYVFKKEIVNYHLEHARHASIPCQFKANYEYMKRKHNSILMNLYSGFTEGKISLEEYDAIATDGNYKNDVGTPHFYRHMNMFREKGMDINKLKERNV